jgi:hypothetical protein
MLTNWTPKWTKTLSGQPLCKPPESCGADHYMVNAAAISEDGQRVVAGTYYQYYAGLTRRAVDGHYGIYIYDTKDGSKPLHAFEFPGDKGIYTVAISGDGRVAAGGGMLATAKANPKYSPPRGLIRAYDADNGNPLLDTSVPISGKNDVDIYNRVSSVALSYDGSVLAAVSAAELYIFRRAGSGPFDRPPEIVILNDYSETVAIHPSGDWVATADHMGNVYVIDVPPTGLGALMKWTAPNRKDPNDPLSVPEPVKFHSVAVARKSDAFAVGGPNRVDFFTRASMSGTTPGPEASYSAVGEDARWVAIADDGSFMTAVVNMNTPQNPGRLLKLVPDRTNKTLKVAWPPAVLDHGPNSTSIDSTGKLITAADGWPNHTAGAFYLFDELGTLLRRYDVKPDEMNWPMQVSANGSGIVAGSDNNTLYFFAP